MNPKGNKESLRPAQPGNRHAEKSGAHSPRRQAEEAKKLEKAYAANPELFLQQDLKHLYLSTRAKLELFDRDIDEKGVSDREGNQRRVVGTHRRYLEMCQKLNAELQAYEAEKFDDTEPFSEEEFLRGLRGMFHDHRVAGSARFAIGQYLMKRRLKVEPGDEEFLRELREMTDEQLERELQYLLVPYKSGRPRGPGHSPVREHPRQTIQRLASQETISDYDLGDLRDWLNALFDPPRRPPSSEDES